MSDIEQATAAPGEVRNITYAKTCWMLIGDGQERCQLQLGHAGECSSVVDKTDSESAAAADERG